MAPITRWKLACAALAAVASLTTIAWQRGGGGPTRQAATSARPAGDPTPRRPIRVAASTLGLSEERLIQQIRAARTGRQVAVYAEPLGVIGTDTAVIALTPLVDDRRAGVPEVILDLFGKIGTERAVALLTRLLDDDRPRVRAGAVAALGSTGTAAARAALLALASDPGDPEQAAAIAALGAMGGDDAAAGLAELAASGDFRTASDAIAALAAIGTAAAEEALIRLVDAPDPRIRALALEQLPPVADGELLARIEALIATADAQTQAAAIGALARSRGAGALDVIVATARTGGQQARWAAVTALGEIGGERAVAVLGEILAANDPGVASAAASALLSIGGPDARAAVLDAALSAEGDPSAILYAMAQLTGDDVDDVRRELARNGSARARSAILPQLVRTGDPDALALAADLAVHGPRGERWNALRALTDAGTEAAATTLVELVGSTHGQTRAQVLEAALQVRPGDPALTQLLIESMTTGRRDEASSALWTLARLDTATARAALVATAGSKDPDLAQAAVSALGQSAGTPEIRAALLAAARDGAPPVRGQALQQLLQAGVPEGVELAEAALTAGDADVARQLMWGLASSGSAEGARLLGRAATSTDPQIRAGAAQSLASIGDDAATTALVAMVRDPEPQVRNSALSALGQVGSARAADAVLAAATTGSTEDRSAAMYALAQLDDPRATDAMVRMIGDADADLAQAAINASYNGGPAIDRALVGVIGNAGLDASRRQAAAQQLRSRGTAVDDATAAAMKELLGDDGEGRGRYIFLE